MEVERRPDAQPAAGFTLLEVMIAAMLLVGGMMAIMGLFGVALATHRANVDIARVAMIRADILPRAQQEALVIDAETGMVSYQSLQRRPVPGYPGFFYELVVEGAEEESGTEVASLVISWYGGGKAQSSRSQHVMKAEKSFLELIQTRFREERQP